MSARPTGSGVRPASDPTELVDRPGRVVPQPGAPGDLTGPPKRRRASRIEYIAPFAFLAAAGVAASALGASSGRLVGILLLMAMLIAGMFIWRSAREDGPQANAHSVRRQAAPPVRVAARTAAAGAPAARSTFDASEIELFARADAAPSASAAPVGADLPALDLFGTGEMSDPWQPVPEDLDHLWAPLRGAAVQVDTHPVDTQPLAFADPDTRDDGESADDAEFRAPGALPAAALQASSPLFEATEPLFDATAPFDDELTIEAGTLFQTTSTATRADAVTTDDDAPATIDDAVAAAPLIAPPATVEPTIESIVQSDQGDPGLSDSAAGPAVTASDAEDDMGSPLTDTPAFEAFEAIDHLPEPEPVDAGAVALDADAEWRPLTAPDAADIPEEHVAPDHAVVYAGATTPGEPADVLLAGLELPSFSLSAPPADAQAAQLFDIEVDASHELALDASGTADVGASPSDDVPVGPPTLVVLPGGAQTTPRDADAPPHLAAVATPARSTDTAPADAPAAMLEATPAAAAAALAAELPADAGRRVAVPADPRDVAMWQDTISSARSELHRFDTPVYRRAALLEQTALAIVALDGDLSEAHRHAQEAYRLRPHAGTNITLAFVLFRLGRYGESLQRSTTAAADAKSAPLRANAHSLAFLAARALRESDVARQHQAAARAAGPHVHPLIAQEVRRPLAIAI